MFAKILILLQHLWKYRERYVVVFVVLLLVSAAGMIVHDASLEIYPTTDIPVSVTTVGQHALQKSTPSLLRIPKIDVITEFEDPLGIDQFGAIEVPKGYEKVGWYKYGPTPGELGPSVILGHIDSYKGPAVFYNLHMLLPGDEIFVDREDGTTAVFEVSEVKTYSQTNFPTEKVYGNIPFTGLRLITCAGTYDKGVQRYSHNLVVFAQLKE